MSSNRSKAIVKRILMECSKAYDLHWLRDSHASSLLDFFSSSPHHPLLLRTGVATPIFISWMIAATDLYEDRVHEDRPDISDVCRLCGVHGESRMHLLTVVPVPSSSSTLQMLSVALRAQNTRSSVL